MTDTKSPLGREERPVTREERLAARLRENLKRRKAQARALGDDGQNEAESQECGLPKTAA
ncbi:hypothetical protein IP81_00390 [Novosphingobium sp. AAP83]|uniref:hypothetical protein n=1 Tax=Novosphingobium sp. AAP83 TaxID=1523425 RepID=UPI0006B9BDC9|nr:hypothetical protein [Novosphingobium sp. AAP83]KPF93973.1 hypothetical protein IP81_00390 [Novosphingobium sp. AAP83]